MSGAAGPAKAAGTLPAETRIRRAAGRMPFGGLISRDVLGSRVSVVHGRDDLTLDDVADYLEALRDVLIGVAHQADRTEAALDEARGDVAAIRRVGRLLGIPDDLDVVVERVSSV